ncbi:hypothetical protein PYX05_30780 [Klebsiella pneumoniae]|nr:hypothetical protein [Klebsiella pneumoniae]
MDCDGDAVLLLVDQKR